MPLPLSARWRINLKTIWKRITLNKLTASFFLFGFLHCFAQGILHSFIFNVDAQYGNLLTSIVRAAQTPPRNHTFLDYYTSNQYRLMMCDWIPHDDTTCYPIFDPAKDLRELTDISDQDSYLRGEIITHSLTVGSSLAVSTDGSGQNINVTLRDIEGHEVKLSTECTGTLLYPQQLLQNYKREDLVWVFLQFWLFAMSFTAMINDSVPHVLACFGARTLATAWSIYVIYRTHSKKSIFWNLIEQPGSPCSVHLFPIYYQTRLDFEISDLILNFTAWLIAGYLSLTLHKLYSAQTFQCLGAPKHVLRLYKFFMAVQACVQLESFVLLTAMGLWIDQLFNTYIHSISEHTAAYEVGFIVTAIMMVPWLYMGWFAIRREKNTLMIAFLGITFGIIVGWSVTLYSQVYRWTFLAWPNLGCWMVASFILLIAILILGLICWRNFGKGLWQYLHAESLLASSDFKPSVFEHDVEKVGVNWESPPLSANLKSRHTLSASEPFHYLPRLPMHSSQDDAKEDMGSIHNLSVKIA